MEKLVRYGNCLIYLWVVVALSRGLVEVFGGEFWLSQTSSNRLPFLALLGVAVLYTVICGLGLLLRKEWGRKLSLPWNVALAFIVGVIPIASVLYVAGMDAKKAILNVETLLGVIVGVSLLALSFGLRSSAVKKHFSG